MQIRWIIDKLTIEHWYFLWLEFSWSLSTIWVSLKCHSFQWFCSFIGLRYNFFFNSPTWMRSILLHSITLHSITLHSITLHCITLHYIALHCIALHSITLECGFIHGQNAVRCFEPARAAGAMSVLRVDDLSKLAVWQL